MIRNVGLSSALNLYRSGVQFGLNITLAHFLTPGDFGQVALVLPITLFILLIGDFGITAAIVRGSPTAREAGAAALICQSFGLALPLLTGLAFAVGGLSFMPHRTAELLFAFSGVAFLAMIAVVPRAILEKELQYGKITTVETVANTAGFVVAVLAAYRGAGVWSFVFYHLVMQGARGLSFWLGTRDKIEQNTELKLAGGLIGFGSWVLAFNLVNYLMRNLDNYIVAAFIGTASLGLYALAYQIMLIPLMVVTWPVSGVLLSTLSRIEDQPDMRRSVFLAVLTLTSSATFPLMTFVALRAEMIFETVLPARWSNVGAVAGLMAVAGGVQSVTALIGALFMVTGRVRVQFWFGLAATAMTLSTLFLVAYISRSLEIVALSYTILTLAVGPAYLAMIKRLLDIAMFRILHNLLPAAVASFAGASAMMLADSGVAGTASNTIRLIVNVSAFSGGALIALAIGHSRIRQPIATLQSAGALASASTHKR